MEQKHKLTGAKEKFRFKMIRILIILVDIFLLYSFRVNKKVPLKQILRLLISNSIKINYHFSLSR